MRWLWYSVLAAAVVWRGTMAGEPSVVLQVESRSAPVQGSRMLLDGDFVGLVGDSVTISPSSHWLTIERPWGLYSTYRIEVANGRLRARLVAGTVCVDNTAWAIDGSSPIVRQQGQMALLELSREDVRYEGVCPIDLPNLQCIPTAAAVHVASTPEVGAEIWVDGLPLGTTTARVLDVSFCVGAAERIEVLLRKPGYTSCKAEVALEGEGGSPVATCTLHPIRRKGSHANRESSFRLRHTPR